MQPLVSIIMVSYNHEAFIAEAIESVLDQTYSNFEFLISDDCSTDHTADVIRQYTDERIKAWYHSEKIDASNWDNSLSLVSKVKGKYIAVIHSDDAWLPDKLKKQVEYMEAHPECAASFTHTELVDENSVRNTDFDMPEDIFLQPNRTQPQWLRYFFSNGNCLCHPSILARSEIYLGLKPNFALRQLPDFDMWIQLVKEHPIYVIQETLTLHRRHLRNNSNVSSSGLHANMVRVNEEAYCLSQTYFENISDDFFIEAFSELFRNPQACKPEELICEKYFLLLDHGHIGGNAGRLSASEFFYKYCGNQKILNTLKNTYGYLLSDYYSITGKIDLDWLGQNKPTFEYQGIILFDTGSGFSGDEIEVFTFSEMESSINWNEMLPQGCTAIRLDPVENFCSIVHNLRISTATMEIIPKIINGIEVGEFIFFDTTDPQILIELPDGYSGYLHITATVLPFKDSEYLLFAREAQLSVERERTLREQFDVAVAELAQIESDLFATEQDLQNAISRNAELAEEIETQYESIRNKDAAILEYQNTISEIFNSSSWKISKPLRVIGQLFKKNGAAPR